MMHAEGREAMKTMAVAAWKYVLVGGLLVAIGILLATGAGRRRGTRAYRWRLAMWTLVLSLIGGAGFVVTGCDKPEDKKADAGRVECYAAMPDDLTVQPDERVMCYERMPDLVDPPDQMILCYAPLPPDNLDQPDEMVMCYEPILDVTTTPDYGQPTCYAPLPPDNIDQPDEMIMCYDPAILDVVSPEDVPQPTCYKPMAPDTWEEPDQHEKEDVPMPTCYMPPPPDDK
jgi:hypothetical protein